MQDLHRKALAGTLRMFVILVAVIFLPVWTLRWWQGWACLAAFFLPASAISVWVARNDPALLERRLKAGAKAEKEKGQKIVQAIAAVVFVADFAVPALDHRFGWSRVPDFICVLGDLMMIGGLLIVFEVFKETPTPPALLRLPRIRRWFPPGPTRWFAIPCTRAH